MAELVVPNTFRSNPAPSQLIRQIADTELWDDLANVVFREVDEAIDSVTAGNSLTVCTLTVGAPVDARLEVHAQVMAYSGAAAGIWFGYVQEDGSDTIWSETQRIPANSSLNCCWFDIIDMTAGSHTYAIRVNVDPASSDIDFYAKRLLIRRGRAPVA